MPHIPQWAGLAAILLLAACGSEVPQTTADERCAQHEWSETYAIPDHHEDVLIVAERSTVARTESRLRELIRTFATGDLDGDADQDMFAASHLRLRLIEPAAVPHVLDRIHCVADARQAARDAHACDTLEGWTERSRCRRKARETIDEDQACGEPLGFVRYRWSPYGYAVDLDGFVDRAMQGDAVDPPEEGEATFPLHPNVVILTERDICTDGAQRDCDPWLADLIEHAQTDAWPLFVFSGVPIELASTSEWRRLYEQSEEERFFQQLLAHPSQQSSSMVGCSSNDIQAAPAPSLLRAVSERPLDPVASLCASEYRSTVGRLGCTGGADSGMWGCTYGQDVRVHDDGTADCRVTEKLPAEGAITRCAQLGELGRSPVAVRMEDGREVCLIQQLPADATNREDLYGWYWQTDPDATGPQPYWREGIAPSCHGVLRCDAPQLQMTPGTRGVPGSTLELSCRKPVPQGELPDCP